MTCNENFALRGCQYVPRVCWLQLLGKLTILAFCDMGLLVRKHLELCAVRRAEHSKNDAIVANQPILRKSASQNCVGRSRINFQW